MIILSIILYMYDLFKNVPNVFLTNQIFFFHFVFPIFLQYRWKKLRKMMVEKKIVEIYQLTHFITHLDHRDHLICL